MLLLTGLWNSFNEFAIYQVSIFCSFEILVGVSLQMFGDHVITSSTTQILLWTVLVPPCSWETLDYVGQRLCFEPHSLFVSVRVYVCVLLLQRRPAVARTVAEGVRQMLWEWSVPHRSGRKHIFCWIWRKELHICFFPCAQKVCFHLRMELKF